MKKIFKFTKYTFLLTTLALTSMLNCMQQNTKFTVGAGVLPYVVEKTESGRKVFFLLGRDFYGKKKGQFSDFGGRSDKNETKAKTAAREGSEETMGILPQDYLEKKIKKSTPRMSDAFLVNIEDIVEKPINKDSMANFIKKLNTKREELLKTENKEWSKLLEKDEFKWWTKENLIKDVKDKNKILRQGVINYCNKNMKTLENIK